MRILHLITDLGKGGAERFTLDLCRELQSHYDAEVVIGTLYPDNRYPDLSAGLRITCLDYQTLSLRRRQDAPAYARLLSEFAPQVVHTHRFLAEFLSSLYVSPTRAYVCHCHDNMVQFRRPTLRTLLSREGLQHLVERRFLISRKYSRVRTAFVANSEDTLAYFTQVLPRRLRREVHHIPYGFDSSRFARRAPERPPVPESAGVLRLVNIGSFQKKKNQALAVDVAAELKRLVGRVQLDLLGDGDTRPAIEEQVRRLGLEDSVHFRGNVDRVEDWLWRSDVYLHTASYEPFGLVFLEAMAAGVPIVARDGKGSRSLLRDGVNAVVLPSESASEFAAAILRLRVEGDLRRGLIERGLRTADEYDIHRRALALWSLYERLRRGAGCALLSSAGPEGVQ